MSPSETSPLISEQDSDAIVHDSNAVYDQFSASQRRTILALVSSAGVFPLFVFGTFLPSVPQVVKDLHSTSSVVSLAISLTILANAIGGLVWASYSTVYGRRPIYLCGWSLFIIGSAGLSVSSTVQELFIWRFVQAVSVAGGISVGSAVIGDIFKLEERGNAVGIFFAVIVIGPTLAPLLGGLAIRYSNWRYLQLFLGLCGGILLVLMIAFLPETRHIKTTDDQDGSVQTKPQRKSTLVNPFSCLWLLRSPNLMAVTLATTLTLLSNYVLLLPISYTIGARYHITDEAIIGACFLPSGLGHLTGSIVAGRLSDRDIAKWHKVRAGLWVPEDRLRLSLPNTLFLLPLSVLFSGLTLEFVPGIPGLVVTLALSFVNGFGANMVLGPCTAYNIDVLESRSADIMAANMGLRALILAIATSAIMPAITSIGIIATDVITAVLGWIAFGLLWCTVNYGDRMRAWVDIGYSTNSERSD